MNNIHKQQRKVVALGLKLNFLRQTSTLCVQIRRNLQKNASSHVLMAKYQVL